ncbi:MAG: hypothetical protein HFF04_06680 [Oscillospiraceae bacterium]|nr:hypothetical protein [Oscillospiraceae bacterium]
MADWSRAFSQENFMRGPPFFLCSPQGEERILYLVTVSVEAKKGGKVGKSVGGEEFGVHRGMWKKFGAFHREEGRKKFSTESYAHIHEI